MNQNFSSNLAAERSLPQFDASEVAPFVRPNQDITDMDLDYDSRVNAISMPPPLPRPFSMESTMKIKKTQSPSNQKKVKVKDGEPKPKRTYRKRNSESENGLFVKPSPKKRGRKSKKELAMMDMEMQYETFGDTLEPSFYKSSKGKERKPKPKKDKDGIAKPKPIKKKQTSSNAGPSMFEKRIFAGPHLTMKQVLDYILTDHSYCVPPDPVPAVASNHQLIRFILGPKNGAKPPPPASEIEKSSIVQSSLPKSRGPLSLPGTPPPSSRLEHLLKRGDVSPSSSTSSSPSRYSRMVEPRDEIDIEVDIENVEEDLDKQVPYDVEKAKEVMTECEKYVRFARDYDTGDDWESKVIRIGWTVSQTGIFDKVVAALHAERLSRLAHKDVGNHEPVLRRAALDRTAIRVRRIFGEYMWDTKLTQWLHGVLNEFLNYEYLAIYLDVLQTLRSMCPELVSRMMKLSVLVPLQNAHGREKELSNLLGPYLEKKKAVATNSNAANEVEEILIKTEEENHENNDESLKNSKTNEELNQVAPVSESSTKPVDEDLKTDIMLPARSVVPQMQDAMIHLQSAKNAQALKALLERQWDPFAPVLFQKIKKHITDPIFVFIAPAAISSKLSLSRRIKLFEKMFRRVGQVHRIRLDSAIALKYTSASQYIEKLFQLGKEKVRQIRLQSNNRPLYVVGWGSGAVLAARLSATFGPVEGTIALGFPLHTLRDIQDDLLKVFVGIKNPVQFVIGGLASNNSMTDMELFRQRLPCETSLVVIGSGNENLYVSRDHREKLLVTQSYVDLSIVQEVSYFVSLHSKHHQTVMPNISSIKQQLPKAQPRADISPKKPVNVNRTSTANKKRKSIESPMSTLPSYSSSDISHNHWDTYSSPLGVPVPSPAIGTPQYRSFEQDFGPPKYMSTSSNKRKGNYKPEHVPTSAPASLPLSTSLSSSTLTASQLVQKGSNVKRRLSTSKPSTPAFGPRVSLLGQHQHPTPPPTPPVSQSGMVQTTEPLQGQIVTSENSIASITGDVTVTPPPPVPLSIAATIPAPYAYTPSANSAVSAAVSSFVSSLAIPFGNKDSGKSLPKKKSAPKPKSPRVPKAQVQTVAVKGVSNLSEVRERLSTNISNILTSTELSSSETQNKYILQQHQVVQRVEDRPDQTSQLYKLLSPGTSVLRSTPSPQASSSFSGTPTIIGTQSIPHLASVSSFIPPSVTQIPAPAAGLSSGQNISALGPSQQAPPEPPTLSNVATPITVPIPTQFTHQALVGGPGDGERIMLQVGDKRIQLKVTELEQLIRARGNSLKILTGMTNQGSVSLVLKKTQESTVLSSSIATVTTSPMDQHPAQQVQSVGSEISAVASTASPIPVEQNVLQTPPPPVPAEMDTSVYVPQPPVSDDTSVSAIDNSTVPIAEGTAESEDEMSGICISSTFSVCPTSGERVDPVIPTSSADISENSSIIPGETSDAANCTSIAMDTSEPLPPSAADNVVLSTTNENSANDMVTPIITGVTSIREMESETENPTEKKQNKATSKKGKKGKASLLKEKPDLDTAKDKKPKRNVKISESDESSKESPKKTIKTRKSVSKDSVTADVKTEEVKKTAKTRRSESKESITAVSSKSEEKVKKASNRKSEGKMKKDEEKKSEEVVRKNLRSVKAQNDEQKKSDEKGKKGEDKLKNDEEKKPDEKVKKGEGKTKNDEKSRKSEGKGKKVEEKSNDDKPAAKAKKSDDKAKKIKETPKKEKAKPNSPFSTTSFDSIFSSVISAAVPLPADAVSEPSPSSSTAPPPSPPPV